MRADSAPTFDQRWRRSVAARGEAPFLLWSDGDHDTVTWTYREFGAVVDEVSAALRERGVRYGSSIHLALTSCPAFVAVWLAAATMGAWVVPSDPKASAEELAGHLRRTRPRVGVCSTRRQDVYAAAVDALAPDERPDVVAIDESDVVFALLRSSHSTVVEFRPAARDRLAVMFTSGTTSAPKGVVLTQANYAFAGDVMASAAALQASDRQLVVLPLFHANAQYYSFASAISVGASVALIDTFSASRFRDQAASLGATHASLFAAPMRMILARDDGRQRVDLQLRHVWFAQNLTAEQYETFSGLVGCRPRQLYGMTETLPAVVTQHSLDACHDVMGHETLGCRVAVVDPATGEQVSAGSIGDLVVSGLPGLTLFDGYLDDPQTTESSLLRRDDDGTVVFRTGDKAQVLSDGSLQFAGRSSEVLKVAGENVSVVEVEAVLAEHPDVFEVAVVGQPDPMRDEVPVAYIVLRADASFDREAFLDWSAERLSPAKRPRDVVLMDELPRTSVGKIRKFLLASPPLAD